MPLQMNLSRLSVVDELMKVEEARSAESVYKIKKIHPTTLSQITECSGLYLWAKKQKGILTPTANCICY